MLTRRNFIKRTAAACATASLRAQDPIPTDDPTSTARIGGTNELADGALAPVRITNQVTVTAAVSDLLCGHFIELGFGRQIEGLRAEMLFNRSFEEIPPYRDAYGWIRRTPQDDLSKEVWWHSGYEEEPWRVEPLSPEVKFQPNARLWFRHGVSQAVLENGTPSSVFLVQRGLWLRQGMTYRFSGHLRSGALGKYNDQPATLRIALCAGDARQKEVAAQDVVVTRDWQKFALELPCRDYSGRATFAVQVPAGASVSCDAFSLMPADHQGGWRAEVVEALRRVNPGIIRFPGGCFASAHHWREGVGPGDERVPRPSVPWGGLEYNDAGTAEFVELCRWLKSEPLLCVNVMGGSAAMAADWVAYCNAPASHPLGALRAAHGHAEPFGVKYWELDNEAFRKYSQAEYAGVCVEFARAMKAVDPSISLVMCGYWHTNETQYEELGPMLDLAGAHIDLVARRGHLNAQQRALAVIRAYNQRTGRHVRLCNTEYLPPSGDVPVLDPGVTRPPTPRDTTLQNRQIRWKYAINTANLLLDYRALGGDFVFSCFNNMANTWGQNVIECAREGVWLSAAGRIFELYSRSAVKWPLKTDGSLPKGLRVEAGWDGQKQRLVLDLINDSPNGRKIAVDLGGAGRFHAGVACTLSASAPAARNSLADPDAVKRTDGRPVPVANGGATAVCEVPPYSVSQVVFVKK